MYTKKWFAKIVIVIALLSIVAACSPGSNIMSAKEIESMLIKKEQQKWDLFGQGDIAAASELYADDFINLGFTPTGMVRQNKKESFDMLAQVPPISGGISLTDFLVVHGDEHSAVVSYKVAAPFGNLYVSSVWAERNGTWTTVFYQASPIFDAAPPATTTESIPFSGLFKSGTDTVLINADGTYAVDLGSTGVYGTTGQLAFSNKFVTIIDDARSDVPVCGGDQRSGTYQYSIVDNNLTFTNVDDQCGERINYFSGREWLKQQ